ncbi:hypothetical protein CIHG_08913 [Coccidioides immitis H538.4]|uniref:Uncharacterized protein n=2 Tax=Coccidioides immitis TaxID=5501 RepID=A0A0J8S495_COCIT|nr:hypothetical protein CIRG_05273 [Coccidioides immitis RMSCC 2394]KMU91164.1 hypothetical protein CIHG_08913 [Coccidioides immitis H538.4]
MVFRRRLACYVLEQHVYNTFIISDALALLKPLLADVVTVRDYFPVGIRSTSYRERPPSSNAFLDKAYPSQLTS